jgi:hypothetical protein
VRPVAGLAGKDLGRGLGAQSGLMVAGVGAGRHQRGVHGGGGGNGPAVAVGAMPVREQHGRGNKLSHPVLKAKPNALITCAPGSSYTHA